MAPSSYNPDAASVVGDAAAAIEGLVETSDRVDRDMPIPHDLLTTLYASVQAAVALIPSDHSVMRILPRFQPSHSNPERTDPNFEVVALYGPTAAKLLREIAYNLGRTNYGAESSRRSGQVTVYVHARDEKPCRQRRTRRPTGDAAQETSQPSKYSLPEGS